MSAQGTLFALSLTIGCLFLELRLLLLLLITGTTSIVYSIHELHQSYYAHNLSNETVYGLVDNNFKT